MNKKEIIGILIGKVIEITSSNNKNLVGLKGEVIDETKNTIKIETENKIKTLIKKQIEFRIKK